MDSSPYSTRTERDQSDSAHSVLSKTNVENAVKLMSNVLASGVHGHLFCSELMFYHWNESLRAAKEKIREVKEHLEEEEEKVSKMFEVED